MVRDVKGLGAAADAAYTGGMRALTGSPPAGSPSRRWPTRRSGNRRMRSSASRPRRSAGRTCTCTGCSGRSCTAAAILVHEAMGVVEAVGADVRRVNVGDRVVIPFVICCGECVMCRSGRRRSARPPRTATTARVPSSTGTRALRLGPGRTGRVPPCAPGGRRRDRRRSRSAGRALPVPQRHPAHGVAQGRLRRRAQGAGGGRPRTGRPVRGADRPSPRIPSAEGRPVVERRLLAERHGAEVFDSDADTSRRCAAPRTAAGPTASSTRSGWARQRWGGGPAEGGRTAPGCRGKSYDDRGPRPARRR